MKKNAASVLLLCCLLCLAGCNLRASVSGTQLLKEGTATKIAVTSMPESYDYSFSGEDAAAVINYLSGLNLVTDYPENPNEYDGMTWVITVEYTDGSTATVYHFGNMFIRADSGPWYKMSFDEANQFESLLNELNH